MLNTYQEYYDFTEQLLKQSECIINRISFLNRNKKQNNKIQIKQRKFAVQNIKIRRYCYVKKTKRFYSRSRKIGFNTSVLKLVKEGN